MKDVQKFPGMDALTPGSLYKRWHDAVGFQSGVRAGTEADLPDPDRPMTTRFIKSDFDQVNKS